MKPPLSTAVWVPGDLLSRGYSGAVPFDGFAVQAGHGAGEYRPGVRLLEILVLFTPYGRSGHTQRFRHTAVVIDVKAFHLE